MLSALSSRPQQTLSTRLSSRERDEKYRKLLGYSKKDTVRVHVLPKGKSGKLGGIYSYSVMTAKAKRLSQSLHRLKSEIKTVEREKATGRPVAGRRKSLQSLKAQMKYLQSQLGTEMMSLPKYVMVVIEEESE